MIFLFVEQCDFCVTLGKHSKGRCLNATHIQGAVIENGKQPRGVDPHQPIRFLTAEGRLIQGFIVGAGTQIRKSLPNGAVLHRGNPKAKDRFVAIRHLIHQTEDQLTFTPGVTGIDNGIHIGAVHQGTEIFKSVLFARCQHIAEGPRQDGQILIVPFLKALVIAARVQRGYQMPHAPGHNKVIAFIKAIGPG